MHAALLNENIEQNEVIVALRDPSFLHNREFVEKVPKRMWNQFMVAHMSNEQMKMKMLKDASMQKAQTVVHYKPYFKKFDPSSGNKAMEGKEDLGKDEEVAEDQEFFIGNESMATMPSDSVRKGSLKDAVHCVIRGQHDQREGSVILGGMDDFGLAVFQSMWDAISKRYSIHRSSSHVNAFDESLCSQADLINAYYSSQYLAPQGAQEEVFVFLCVCEHANHSSPRGGVRY